uniref:Uncharacterized protein n=1 Tax=Aegilops tauschii TaxID=37682 RepID=M8CT78_AEGTA
MARHAEQTSNEATMRGTDGKKNHHGAFSLGVVQARGLPRPPGGVPQGFRHLPLLPRSRRERRSLGETGIDGEAS